MPDLLSPALIQAVDRIGKDALPYLHRRLAQVCTSAGNTETGDPKTGDGRLWMVTQGNRQMPIRVFNAWLADDLVGHWGYIADARGSGFSFVVDPAWEENVQKGGSLYAAHAASGPQQSPDTMTPRHNYSATVAPTVNDDSSDRWSVNSLWTVITGTVPIIYICRSATIGAAKWDIIAPYPPYVGLDLVRLYY